MSESKKQELLDALSPVMLEEDLEKVKEHLIQQEQHARLEWMHNNWKAKQDLVPESPGDWFIFRDPKGSKAVISLDGKEQEVTVHGEIRLTRDQVDGLLTSTDLSEDVWINIDGRAFKLLSVVKLSLGEAEKSAK
jgi:hypothetical protein